MNPPANWYPDPTGRHGQRYWDGEQWTEHVFTDGVQDVDPLEDVAEDDGAAADEDVVDAGTDLGEDEPTDDAPVDEGDGATTRWTPDDVDDHDTDEVATAVEAEDVVAAVDETVAADERDFSDAFVLAPETASRLVRRGGGAGDVEQEEDAAPTAAAAPVDAPPPLPTRARQDVATSDESVDAPVAGDVFAAPAAAADAPEPTDQVEDTPQVEAHEEGPVDEAVHEPATTEDVEDDWLAQGTAAARTDDAPGDRALDDTPDEPAPTPRPSFVDAPPPTMQPPAAAAPAGGLGITGDLLDGDFAEREGGAGVGLQNSRMLRVDVDGTDVIARQGTMVAYQGNVEFERQGAGGVTRALKRAATGEGLAMMRVSGTGDVFFADGAQHVFLLHLDGGPGLSVNGRNVLAFSAALDWDIERVKGATLLAGGLFNTTLRGSGWVALVSDGEPVVLRTDEAPTYVDVNALVAWSGGLGTRIVNSVTAKSLVGLGSGEAFQMAFDGAGIVIVQPSEGAMGGAVAT